MFIGISQRLIRASGYDEIRTALALEWSALFAKGGVFEGFLPLPLSYDLDLAKFAPFLNGVILSGGNDLSVVAPNDELSLKRDKFELELISYCLENDLPLLGICRGAQLIASHFNGIIKPCKNHTAPHFINDKSGGKFMVNSYHNYAIYELGKDLIATHFSDDKSIEGFVHKFAKIYGAMWHIERVGGLLENPAQTPILLNFLRAIKEKK